LVSAGPGPRSRIVQAFGQNARKCSGRGAVRARTSTLAHRCAGEPDARARRSRPALPGTSGRA
jgi:hypothetical protein